MTKRPPRKGTKAYHREQAYAAAVRLVTQIYGTMRLADRADNFTAERLLSAAFELAANARDVLMEAQR